MSAVDQYILGNSALYERLCLITEVLGKFVSSAPRAVDIAQLEKQTGRPAKELQKLCAMLCREQLLQLQPGQPYCWRLACEASQVTLEDAFRCVVAEKTARVKTKAASVTAEEAGAAVSDGAVPRREVDLLVMQATMGINQSVFRHLRQFSLDRLKVTAAGMLPARRPAIEAWPYPRPSFS